MPVGTLHIMRRSSTRPVSLSKKRNIRCTSFF